MDETVVKEVINAVSESNMMTYCAQDGPLGTSKKRAAYVRREFPLVRVCCRKRQKNSCIRSHFSHATEVTSKN